jgi:hypothetical protein
MLKEGIDPGVAFLEAGVTTNICERVIYLTIYISSKRYG